MLLYCEDKEGVGYTQITERFGQPKEMAETFLAEMDPRVVSRFAYARLRFGYLAIAIVLIFVISVIGSGYFKAREMASNPTIIHKDGRLCTYFCVPTVDAEGRMSYWGYHTCINNWQSAPKPKDATGLETPAVEVYTYSKEAVTHWKYDPERGRWTVIPQDG